MNFNTSPIAFFPSRAAQIWRAWFAQRKISVICGNDLLPFYIIDNGNAPTGGELYDPNTDTKVDDIDFTGYSAHTMTFKASAWNALSSAEQTTIDNILSGKNWNRAIA